MWEEKEKNTPDLFCPEPVMYIREMFFIEAFHTKFYCMRQ